MTVFAYLRVSTNRQDVDNQRFGILEYANACNLGSLRFVEDTASGKVNWRSRSLGKLLEGCKAGDCVVFAEVSRIARSLLQVLEVLEYCSAHQISVFVAKQRLILDGSMQSTITATVLGLAAQIEREFISMRTVEALAKRRAEGKSLGRPKGSKSVKVKLDNHATEIRGYLDKKISKAAIAKLVNCSPTTLYSWLKRRKVA